MLDRGHHLCLRGAVARQLVRDHDTRGPHCRFSSLRSRRLAARLSRRLWTRRRARPHPGRPPARASALARDPHRSPLEVPYVHGPCSQGDDIGLGDLIACAHMSGLLARSHMSAGQGGRALDLGYSSASFRQGDSSCLRSLVRRAMLRSLAIAQAGACPGTRFSFDLPRKDKSCPECGHTSRSRLGRRRGAALYTHLGGLDQPVGTGCARWLDRCGSAAAKLWSRLADWLSEKRPFSRHNWERDRSQRCRLVQATAPSSERNSAIERAGMPGHRSRAIRARSAPGPSSRSTVQPASRRPSRHACHRIV